MRTLIFTFFLFCIANVAGYYNWTSEIRAREVQMNEQKPSERPSFVYLCLFHAFLMYFMRLIDYEFLKSHNIHFHTKEEYHSILENQDETIMTHDSGFCIQYFNSKGYEFLKMIAGLTNDEAHFTDLQGLQESINSHSQVKSLDKKSLFQIPIFKLFTENRISKMGEDMVSQSFCLNNFLDFSDEQLHAMVFVNISCPDNLNLDEKLIMKTTFY